jgi:hypothetical protein
MAEVFTISGASDASDGCPVGWHKTPAGHCGGAPPSYRVQAAVHLQMLLALLGKRVGNQDMAEIQVDGIVGPQTVDFVNKALRTYLGESGDQVVARVSDPLTMYQVAEQAQTLASRLKQDLEKRGIEVPPLPMLPTPQRPRVSIGPAEILPPPKQSNAGRWALAALLLGTASAGVWLVLRESGTDEG